MKSARAKAGVTHRLQTVMLSATITRFVRALAAKVLQNPVAVDADSNSGTTSFLEVPAGKPAAGGAGLAPASSTESPADEATGTADAPDSHFTPKNLSQYYIPVPVKWRLVTLLGLLRRQFAEQYVGGLWALV